MDFLVVVVAMVLFLQVQNTECSSLFLFLRGKKTFGSTRSKILKTRLRL
jgi:hypothetical protein